MSPGSAAGLGPEDHRHLEAAGVDPAEAERQLALLREPPPPTRLDRPCAVGDGIVGSARLAERSTGQAALQAVRAGRVSKFVPASGAASRMFDFVRRARQGPPGDLDELRSRADHGDAVARDTIELLEGAAALPFAEALGRLPALAGRSLDRLTTGEEIRSLLDALLDADGLDLDSLPKGLVPFHKYAGRSRTAFVEHLVEGLAMILDREKTARYHFTVPPSHASAFEAAAQRFAAGRQETLRVGFSTQSEATHTLALDRSRAVARDDRGRPLLRPGGHGALLTNLERCGGDVVLLKNIDNIVPEQRHPEVIAWLERLLDELVRTEQRSRRLQEALESNGWRDALDDAEAFCDLQLNWRPGATSVEARRAQLLHRLDRPLRVCGMVRNEGEPGGGPFWVREPNGGVSLQIVESAQVDHDDPEQEAIWRASTHFNPVLLAVSLRDRHGDAYRLSEYVDPGAVVVTEKSLPAGNGRVLERPGLWNGSMAHWNTIFAEVPLATFAPVKTLLDLLRPAHRTGAG